MNRDSASGFGIGLLVGMAAGVAIGLLYAPRRGEEMRELVRERASDVGEKAKETFNKIRGRVSRSSEDMSEQV
jgi:gas vesicle protein